MDWSRIGLAAAGLVAVIAFNFAPTLIAYAARHPERRRLASLNVLSLASFLLWIALLVWAVGGKRDDSVIGRFVADGRNQRVLTAGVVVLVAAGVATTAYALTRA